ncbi:DUF4232 domain-containing protein [Micromonospora echinofusca]|uniref:DUF4232 domain-containing protein n=1 Tax=Micromonospora echinofusca TaxID=47858 RepID=A0ABS3VST2_MICEH|nr:DUF4232 domain-containing protein [Micromonospora echinofusca]MBO4207576.1 DUF4232 domain-containing protein [Micromonospora echinofusca]
MSRLTRPAVAAAASVLLVAGCAHGPRTIGSWVAPGRTPGQPAGTGAGGGPVQPVPTGGATSGPGRGAGAGPAALCRAAALRLRLTLTGGGMGNRYASLEVSNTSATPCAVQGFVDLTRYDRSGRPLPTRVVREGPVPAAVTLAPGGSAWVGISWTMIPGAGEASPTACEPLTTAFDVLVPGAGPARRVPLAAGRICEGGRLTVGPLSTRRPARSAAVG